MRIFQWILIRKLTFLDLYFVILRNNGARNYVFSKNFITLPEAFRGSASWKLIPRGTL